MTDLNDDSVNKQDEILDKLEIVPNECYSRLKMDYYIFHIFPL